MEIYYTAVAHQNVYRGEKSSRPGDDVLKENIQEKTLSKDIFL